MHRLGALALASTLMLGAAFAGARSITAAQATSQTPPRDTSAQQAQLPPPAARISGRVLAADNKRPLKRARVLLTAAELPGGRGAATDDSGAFEFTELPAGRYTVTASKAGFVSLSYGQRRPLQGGTPLQLSDGQYLKGVDFQLPRGSVIGGKVFDEDGEPMPGVAVRIMRYQYLQGDRRLSSAGSGQTDDKGQYRVWGLMPGEYYVNAVVRGNGGPFGGFGRGQAGGGRQGAGSGGEVENINYAPTYYPGVSGLNEAKSITLGLSQELLDINFSMQLVPMAMLGGHVDNPDGSPVTSGSVNLTLDVIGTRGNQIGQSFGGRIQWDGEFTIRNVPPGRYTLRARGDDSDPPQYASVPLSINGVDVPDLTIILQRGATISGMVTFLGGTSPPDMRMAAPATDQSTFGPQPSGNLNSDGTFTISGVAPGFHLIRPAGSSRGWTLKSVDARGRDVTDAPIEVRSGETLTNVVVLMTDRLSELNGTVTNNQGQPAPEYTILAFPTDATLWRPQARQIMTARPDQTGTYRMRGLPPGDYYVVMVDPTEAGEWFEPAYLDEHRPGAIRVAIGEGDVKTQDFRVK